MGVVISPDLVLASDLSSSSITANNPLIGWHNLVVVGSIEAESADPLFPVSNLANPMTHRLWKSISMSSQTLEILSSVDPVDYVAVAGHNWGTGSVAVKLEGTETDGGLWVELIPEFIPSSDNPIIMRFDPHSYFAVRIVLTPTLVVPVAAVVHLGLLLVLQRRIYVGHRPILFNEDVNSVIGVSDKGQYLGSLIIGAINSGRIIQDNITPDFYRTYIEPWRVQSVRKLKAFFFAWRPGGYPNEVAYCWPTVSNMNVENKKPNGMMGFSVDVQGIVS